MGIERERRKKLCKQATYNANLLPHHEGSYKLNAKQGRAEHTNDWRIRRKKRTLTSTRNEDWTRTHVCICIEQSKLKSPYDLVCRLRNSSKSRFHKTATDSYSKSGQKATSTAPTNCAQHLVSLLCIQKLSFRVILCKNRIHFSLYGIPFRNMCLCT